MKEKSFLGKAGIGLAALIILFSIGAGISQLTRKGHIPIKRSSPEMNQQRRTTLTEEERRIFSNLKIDEPVKEGDNYWTCAGRIKEKYNLKTPTQRIAEYLEFHASQGKVVLLPGERIRNY
ncbi:MAG: hypothetical protein KKF68_03450 [Nanoarchaeota archaeon]|nr:hypothetical protein [Nanoarchaeota archaeon]